MLRASFSNEKVKSRYYERRNGYLNKTNRVLSGDKIGKPGYANILGTDRRLTSIRQG